MERTSLAQSSPVLSSATAPEDGVVTWFHIGSTCSHFEPIQPIRPSEHQPEAGLTVVVCTYKRARSLDRFLDSLAAQEHTPDRLIIVDASPGDETERTLANRQDTGSLASCVLYYRVCGPLMGLTRQRNFALRWVETDLVAFFDDDIVLLPHCLQEMEKSHRAAGGQVVGVGSFIQKDDGQYRLEAVWRVASLLGVVSDPRPGRYQRRTGNSTPWYLMAPTDELVEGDWLPGGATMWKSAVVREVGFHDGFNGYGLGEDLDFSLRARKHGKLLMAGAAQVLHLHEPGGRVDAFRLGYMEVHNRHLIFRRQITKQTWRDTAWFTYAWAMDTLLLARHLRARNRWGPTFKQIAGRLRAAYDLVVQSSKFKVQ